MSNAQAAGSPYLVARAGGKRLALALPDVIETMRTMPVSRLGGVPPFVLGAAVVRGAPVPVIDARALLGEGGPAEPGGRFISLRQGARQAALAVDEVLGVRALAPAELPALPPLLQGVAAGLAEALAAVDERLLVLLRSGRLVPDEAWRAMAREAHE